MTSEAGRCEAKSFWSRCTFFSFFGHDISYLLETFALFSFYMGFDSIRMDCLFEHIIQFEY